MPELTPSVLKQLREVATSPTGSEDDQFCASWTNELLDRLALLEKALNLACVERATISGSAELFKRRYLTLADDPGLSSLLKFYTGTGSNGSTG